MAPTTRVPAVRRAGPAAAAPRRAAWGVCAHRFVPALALIAVLGAAGPARAQLFADDDARKAILELRQRINALQSELGGRLDTAQRNQLDLANQNETLRQEIARLRGQVETLTNEIVTLQKRNRELYADLDARLKAFEPVTTNVDGRQATVERAEQAAYDAALNQFRAGDFRAAAGGLQSFLQQWPKSAYAASANYWLGNSLYGLKDYKGAIAAQQVVVDRHPDSPRAPDALLNIAASQVELKDGNRARAALQKIIADYPNTEAAKVAAERLKVLGRK